MGFMLIWLVLGYVQPFMAIANTAHLAGLISGVVLAWFDSQRDQQASISSFLAPLLFESRSRSARMLIVKRLTDLY